MLKPPWILPQPTRVEMVGASWLFDSTRGDDGTAEGLGRLRVGSGSALIAQEALLADYLSSENQITVERAEGEACDIELLLAGVPRQLAPASKDAGFEDEAYQIRVTARSVRLVAATVSGIARAIQSLRQMLEGQRGRLELPGLLVEDGPALAWRGLHLDVARHFRTADEVCRFIDLAAWHKFNVFHWHLTDDQGWRLPIAGYERLVEVAAWREGTLIGHDSGQAQVEIDGVPHGGCYTAEEIQRVVAYAAVRGVRILPEVDVPGHVQALLTAYPEMGTTDRVPGVRPRWGISESTLNLEPVTFEFLARVVETLAELFPFPFIHFGGDEAKTEEWAASARVQEQKRERGLTSDRDVQGVFTEELQCWAKRHGRRFMGWDEVVDSGKLTEEAAVMFWRDEGLETEPRDRAALAMGLPLVLANWSWTYFDHYQVAEADRSSEPLAIGGELPLEKVYRWAPLARYEPEWHAQILGAQAQVWTEYIPTQAHLDYMVYPRACAMAQVLWTGSQREDWEAFQARLSEHLPRLGRRGVAYRPIKAKG